MSGIQTKNLPLRQSVDELIGHDSQDSTVRISREALTRLVGNGIAAQITNAGGMAVFASVAAGLAATSEGDYFSVPSPDDDAYLILYRNDNGVATEVRRYPSVEAVDHALDYAQQITRMAVDLASEPTHLHGDFYRDVRQEDSPAFAVVGPNGRAVLSFRGDGIQQLPWRGEFHVEEGSPLYAWADSSLRIFHAVDDRGASVVGGGIDANMLPTEQPAAGGGKVYLNYSMLRRSPVADSFFDIPASHVLPDTATFYGMFDDLASEFPDYLAKEVLGQDAVGNDIVQYTATPAGYWTRWYDVNAPEVLEKPKVVLFGCTHGNEKYGALTNYQFLREMCLRWKEDERLAYLRWGVKLVLIPVVNPSGFNAGGERRNHNNVDLNRNFPHRWEDAEPDLRGSAPASEAETQIVLGVFDAHSDACAFIDKHGAGSLNSPQPYAYWIGTERGETVEIARVSCDHMMRYLRKEFPYVDQSNGRITRLVDSFPGTLAKHVQGALDKNGFTLETGVGFANIIDQQKHALEALTNLIHLCVLRESARRVRQTQLSYP